MDLNIKYPKKKALSNDPCAIPKPLYKSYVAKVSIVKWSQN